MRSKGYYTVIGLMVVALSVVAIALGVMLEFGGTKHDYKRYQILFTEPVDGLSEQAPVKLNGVTVGVVNSISIDKNDIAKVKVIVNIEQSTPIMTSTVARLTPQGITGLEYISLRVKHNSNKPITAQAGELPQIPSGNSIFRNLIQQASKIEQDIRLATKQLTRLFSDKNVRHVNQVLESLDKTSQQFRENIMPGMTAALSNVNNMMPAVTSGVNQLEQLMQQTQQLIESLQRNPSIILHGTLPPAPGPGEAR